MSTLLEKLQAIVDDEVKKQLMKYAHVISKRHDISLKLLLQDIGVDAEQQEEVSKKAGQCLGITAKMTQCKTNGKHGGYCMRHQDQKKEKKKPIMTNAVVDKNPHIGHTMKECLFLAGCPACEKSRGSSQNLLIDL